MAMLFTNFARSLVIVAFTKIIKRLTKRGFDYTFLDIPHA
jgi:hypothetical protein